MTESQKTPHGKRVSDAVMEARMAFIENLMTDGEERAEIVARSCVEFPPMRPRTVDDYCARVRERWARESAAERPTERAATVKRLRRKCNDLWKKGACGPAIQLERLLVDIVGLRAPEPVEVKTAEGTKIDWRDLVAVASSEELEVVDRVTHAAEEHRKTRVGEADVSDFPDDEDGADDATAPDVAQVTPEVITTTTPAMKAPLAATAVATMPNAAVRKGSHSGSRRTASESTASGEAPQAAAPEPQPRPPTPGNESVSPTAPEEAHLRGQVTSADRAARVRYLQRKFGGPDR